MTMEKQLKKRIGIGAGIALLLVIVGFVAVMCLRIDVAKAEQIALELAGGGQIVEREISSEGLWNEYSFTIQNGEQWCSIELNGFGHVEEMESGIGDTWRY